VLGGGLEVFCWWWLQGWWNEGKKSVEFIGEDGKETSNCKVENLQKTHFEFVGLLASLGEKSPRVTGLSPQQPT
jgi:hypothetical protein